MKRIITYSITFLAIIGISVIISTSSLVIQFVVISSLALTCLPFIIALQRKYIDIFAPIWFFGILYTIGYGYKAALIVFSPEDFITFPRYFPKDLEFIIYAFFLSLLGLAAFYLGYFTRFYKLITNCLPSLGDNVIGEKRLCYASLFGISIGIIALLVLMQSISVQLDWESILTILFNVAIRNAIMSQLIGNGFLFFLLTLVPFFALVYLYYVLRKRTKRSVAWIVALLTFTAAILSTSILGARMLLMGLMIGTTTLYNYRVRRINLLTGLILIVIAGWLAGILGVMLSSSYSTFFAVSFYDIILRFSATFEFFDDFVTALVHIKDFFGGATIFEDFVYTYLPRAIFPWKPLIYGQVKLQEAILPGLYAESGFANTMTMGILAEGYANFGVAGVLLLPAVLGIFLRGLYEKAMKEGGLYLVIYGFTLGSMLNTLRGFGSYIIASLILIATCWLFYKAPLALPVAGRRDLVRRQSHEVGVDGSQPF
jgi:oligosaccharide repeat unit polymerase